MKLVFAFSTLVYGSSIIDGQQISSEIMTKIRLYQSKTGINDSVVDDIMDKINNSEGGETRGWPTPDETVMTGIHYKYDTKILFLNIFFGYLENIIL